MTECVASAYETADGWAYSCLCGYESTSTMSKEDAVRFAAMHQKAGRVKAIAEINRKIREEMPDPTPYPREKHS